MAAARSLRDGHAEVTRAAPSSEAVVLDTRALAALYTETSGRCVWLLLEPISDAMAA